ncbi:hypothetical protein [Carnobacterium mobile]|uniref:hypothetical protein n=1 Tax=Carnobacterium mobile TaxID=2750 RepID=UPI0005595948|nr:hypothetical protein [Carnobacterium mobile]
MQKLKLTRFKEGFLYSLIFMTFNIIKNLIFKFQEINSLLHEISQNKEVALPIIFGTIVVTWLVLSLLIGIGLILFDLLKKWKSNNRY